jgi:hypothetical protein
VVKKNILLGLLIIMNGKINTSINSALLQTNISKLQNDVAALNGLLAVPVQVPSSTFSGFYFFVSFTDVQKKIIWSRAYMISGNSLAAINQALQSEGGVFIIPTAFSQLPYLRLAYNVYGAKSFNLVESQTFDVLFNQNNLAIPTSQVQQYNTFSIQYQLQEGGPFIALKNVPFNQPTLLQVTA